MARNSGWSDEGAAWLNSLSDDDFITLVENVTGGHTPSGNMGAIIDSYFDEVGCDEVEPTASCILWDD